MDLKLVILDIAGTCVADNGEVTKSFKGALEEHGITVTDEQINNIRGLSKRTAVRNLIPKGADEASRGDAVYESFCARLKQQYAAKGVHPIAGAREVFSWFRNRGVCVALNTGFDRSVTDVLICALKWDVDVVDVVVSGDEVSQGRPAPYLIFRAMEATRVLSVHSVANVGDTVLDLRAGYNAGVRWNLGVLSGAHNRQKLEMEPHTHLLQSISDLPAFFCSIPE